ncbi:preprotein translocase subunit SecG [Maricaulis sp.]|uniref:preprotein translocase subunit SecG n=1 Tax=Maricaulis sp. TaxID=1486257 RepID=UPI0026310A5F|nr:preprotein translocase subunit SecG [Maricaulis sp.]
MTTVLLIIQVLIAVALTVVVLLQRSEGGALGIGGGQGSMMSGRSAATVLTRTTMVLAALFIGNSIFMAVLVGVNSDGSSIFDNPVDLSTPALLEEEADQVPTDG